jgi:hypothetical protein
MRGRRRLLIGSFGLWACLSSGCLRDTLQTDAPGSRSDVPSPIAQVLRGGAKRPNLPSSELPSDYQICLPPPIQSKARPLVPPVTAVDLRIDTQAPPPTKPADPPAARMEVQPAPIKADFPLVQALRTLLEHRSAEEVREQLKLYDPPTREAMLVLLGGIVRLEESGGVERTAPRDLAVLADRLNGVTAGLRARAQLTLDNTCFCSHIEDFGKFEPLQDSCFQPGQEAKVYARVRNFTSRREGPIYKTVLRARLEFFDETNREKPFVIWNSTAKTDLSRLPRQDYFVNSGFRVPRNWSPGAYTVWITVEDLTLVVPGQKAPLPSRIARSSLDFRVVGGIARHRHPPLPPSPASR